jgi:NAD(P)-dependent dehydrogenase (short-subunit alcohol dehydrogenase family)
MARVFISGSSTGLGLMAGQLLVEQGHRVVLHARNGKRANDARRALPRTEEVVTHVARRRFGRLCGGGNDHISGGRPLRNEITRLGLHLLSPGRQGIALDRGLSLGLLPNGLELLGSWLQRTNLWRR